MPNFAIRARDRLYALPVLLLTLTALFWAGNTIAGRLAVGHVSPMLLTLLRWAMVLAVLWPLYGREIISHWPEIKRWLPRLTLMAALGFTGFNALFYVAAHATTAVNLGIIQGSIPVFVLMMAFLAHGTRATLLQMVGVLVTTVGVAMVATRGAPLDVLGIALNHGDLAMLLACVLYAFYTVALKDRPEMPGTSFFTLLATVAAVTAVPFAAAEWAVGQMQLPTLQGWLVTLYVAVFPSCLSQLFYMRGVELIGPGRAGVYVNLVPVFAAMLGVGLLGEVFAWYHAVALALVLGGIWLAQHSRSGEQRGG